ncbi:MAG: hypothetical protein KBG20_14170, partial [Caldilineaceae bacterium]|nr:hypothetical protein [Caldilineaceae bacterium]
PLQTSLSLIVANNLILLSSFVLGGFGAYLVAQHVLSSIVYRVGSGAGGVEPKNTRYSILDTHDAALFAGIVFAFASSKLFYAALGQANIASSQWVPFTVLFVLRTGESRTRRAAFRNAGFAALFLTLQAWAELTYASFLLIFIGVYFVTLLIGWFVDWWTKDRLQGRFRDQPALVSIRPETAPVYSTDAGPLALEEPVEPKNQPINKSPLHPFTPSPFPPFILMGLLFIAGIAPFLWAMLPDMLSEGDFFASGGGFADVFSADLFGYLVPTRLHPLVGQWVAGLAFPNDKAQHIYIGYVAMILAGMGAWALVRSRLPKARSQGWFWLISTGIFWLLTLGPTVRVMGQDTGVPGPFGLVSLLPFFSGNRYPSRYAIMLMLGVAVLAAVGLAALLRRLARSPLHPFTRSPLLLISVISIIFLAEHLSVPMPINDSRVPPIYQQIAAVPGDFAVLELPTGWRNGARVLGKSDLVIMMQQWAQAEHDKRRLGGNTSRNPGYKFDYFTNAPLLGDLIALMNADQPHLAAVIDPTLNDLIAQNRAIAPTVLDFLDVRFITLDMARSPAQLVRFVEEALPVTLVDTWTGPDWTGAPDTIRLYRVDDVPVTNWMVDLAADAGRLYLAEGWSSLSDGAVRYATRSQPALLLDLPDGGGVLTLQTVGPAPLAGVRVAGRELAFAPGDDGTVEIQVPPGLATQPVDRVVLDFGTNLVPAPRIPGGDSHLVGKTGIDLGTHSIVVMSAGEEVGDYGRIFVDGMDVALGQRGYNLAALTKDGELMEIVVFDTFADPADSVAMTDWLGRWPNGTVIAGAVKDEASLNLSQEAVNALARIGVMGNLRGRFRWSHAFVGVVGVSPGKEGVAAEAASLLHPASVVVGSPVDALLISAGVGAIHFAPN